MKPTLARLMRATSAATTLANEATEAALAGEPADPRVTAARDRARVELRTATVEAMAAGTPINVVAVLSKRVRDADQRATRATGD
ncbi:hypothetical protein Ga0074812_14847 [Parafrankia irregularis]|uniref:Uncharacterized protein n=1 Tax=Parafrankia irregularis TaxID=795642 RepID=A0A0S4R0C1_9ACTN|nr:MULTISPECIES: hypothetical protein [Parafrankia]MBE3206771.1 hypothetical protein [Parafrankia sp. CH37]CUU60847.1 hypothetical protein Ga0074812_14847 [Parafrankia irregularis]